jgi:hypothetical protein
MSPADTSGMMSLIGSPSNQTWRSGKRPATALKIGSRRNGRSAASSARPQTDRHHVALSAGIQNSPIEWPPMKPAPPEYSGSSPDGLR